MSSSESQVSHLRAADEEHEAGNSADAVQTRNIREVVKIVSDIVLQKAHSRLLPVRLRMQ
jgi:hypothetical protein